MTKREDIEQRELEGLEEEFRSLLPCVLKQCAAGRWGLFGQNDHPDGSKNPYFVWVEAEQLKKMAHEIRSIRRDAISSQVIDALEAQEIKETGNEKGYTRVSSAFGGIISR
jgi:hypothetical protein